MRQSLSFSLRYSSIHRVCLYSTPADRRIEWTQWDDSKKMPGPLIMIFTLRVCRSLIGRFIKPAWWLLWPPSAWFFFLHVAYRSRIHERTISLRFLGIILRVLSVRQSCYPATCPSKLLDGYQGHPPFLPVAWDRPAATEPGSETVYRRHTFIQSTFVDSRRQCKMRLKPENRKDLLTMIYVT